MVDEHYRGRVFAADHGLFTLAFSISVLGTGILLDFLEARVVAFLAGVSGVLFVALWFYFVRKIPLVENQNTKRPDVES